MEVKYFIALVSILCSVFFCKLQVYAKISMLLNKYEETNCKS